MKVGYLDRTGARQELEAMAFWQPACSTEIDHLNGVLFIDHISRLKRERVIKKFAKDAKRRAEEAPSPRGMG